MREIVRYRFAAIVVPLMLLSAAVPSSAATMLRIPGDSVLVQFGAYRQWIRLAGVASPDTSFLGPDNDLILRTGTDSVLVPRSLRCATVRLARTADTLTEVFFFETRRVHDMKKYQSLLRRYSRYGRDPAGARVVFDDRPAHDPESDEIRAMFPIDSIAGSGGDLSRMRNLLHWVHGTIRWDGSRENPTEATLGKRMEVCLTRGLTMNCGGLAESYAAVCRAAGLNARRIVCLPFDRQDPDCHSVVIVYSDSLGRWVYMDPTFEAYWTDAEGNLLDLARARALLAKGETVLLNPEANVNGQHRDTAEHLAYMSKNLFRFKVWPTTSRTVILNPRDYESSASDSTASASGASIITDNPAVFWAPPGKRTLRRPDGLRGSRARHDVRVQSVSRDPGRMQRPVAPDADRRHK